MTEGQPVEGQVKIGPERILGTVKAQVIFVENIGLYVIAMKDKFGIDGTRAGRSEPSETVVLAAMAQHARVSQSATKRN